MAATDTTKTAATQCERDEHPEVGKPLEVDAPTMGPLRNPDDCVLACADCSCRRLLALRRPEPAPGN